MHKYVELAKKTIDEYVKKDKTIPVPENLSDEMKEPRACFVSLKKQGQLRGCIGTIEPVRESLAEEIIENAISASTRDSRFPAVTADEIDDLTISVDVLTSPEPVSSLKDLDPKKYGVIVQSGFKRGLLLPDLEGVDTVEHQVSIAAQKAGIHEGEQIQLFRFEVNRFH
ncbi:MAG: AmmeMemoRadiSam system protein A [Armatimonadota bacterium]